MSLVLCDPPPSVAMSASPQKLPARYDEPLRLVKSCELLVAHPPSLHEILLLLKGATLGISQSEPVNFCVCEIFSQLVGVVMLDFFSNINVRLSIGSRWSWLTLIHSCSVLRS